MANYVINYSGGTITLTSGNANVETGLTLMGQNYANYGQPMNQNWMSLLENFASNTSVPNLAVAGMIWYDAANTQLRLNTGNGIANWHYIVTTENPAGNSTFDILTANSVVSNTLSGDGSNVSNIDANNITGGILGNAHLSGVYNLNTTGTANLANFAGNVTVASQPNITSVGTLTSLTVAGNISSNNLTVSNNANITGNLSVGGTITGNIAGNISGNLVAPGANTEVLYNYLGNVTASPNFTFNGNSLIVNGNANATTFYGSGSGLTNIPGASVTGQVAFAAVANSIAGSNVSGTVANAAYSASAGVATTATTSTITGTVTTNAQPNITSLGTLTVLNVNGTVTATSIVANTGIFSGNGAGLTNIPGGNVTGTVANATNAVVASSANSVAGANVTGIVANANYADFAGTAFNVTAANVVGTVANANYAVFAGTAYNVSGSNVSGQVANANFATYATHVTDASQPNITSLGILSSLNISGNANANNLNILNTANIGGNLNVTGVIYGNIVGNISGNLVVPGSSTEILFNDAGQACASPNLTFSGTSLNVTGVVNATSYTGNAANLSHITGANVSGAVANATHANTSTTSATVTTNAQPNITSLGTLTSLNVNDQANVVTLSSNAATGSAPFIVQSTTKVANLNAELLDGYDASIATVPNTVVVRDGNGNVNANVLVVNTISATSVVNGTSNVSIPSPSGNVAISSAGNANIVVVTGTGVNVSGTLNTTGNANVGNIGGTNGVFTANVTAGNVYANAGTIGASLLTGTLTTNSQPNVTNVGTLSGLDVNGTVTAANITANTGIFTGNASGLSVINASNITTGTLDQARLANSNVVINGVTISLGSSGTINAQSPGTLTLGSYLTGGSYNGSSAVTTAVDATEAATANKVVARDANGSFAANVITANTFNGIIIGDGANIANINASNIATGTLAQARLANSSVILGSTSLTLGTTVTDVSGLNGISSNLITGTLTTASQPNVTTVGTLTDLNVSGNAVIGGNITVNGNIAYVNVETLSVEDPIIQLQTGANGAAPVSNSGKDVGSALNYYDTQARVAFMGWDVSNTEFTFGSQVSITNEVVTVISLGNVRAGNFVGTFIGVADSANTAGTVTTAAQPNITSVGILTGLNVNGNITAANITANTGVFSGNGSGLTNLNGSNITTGTIAQSRLANSSLTVNGTTISLGGTATITANTTQSHSNGAYITGGIFNGGTAVTWAVDATDAATANKIVARDANGSFAANVITANSFSGIVIGDGANIANINASNIATGTLSQSRLANSSLTVNGTAISLGGSATITANTTQTLTFNNGGAGDASGTTFNGGTARTISYNTVGAPSTTGTNASGTWGISITGSAATAGTVTTAAQPNITSVGTLSSLAVTGNVTAGNANVTGQLISTVATGTAPMVVSSTTKVANLNADLLDGYDLASAATASTVVLRSADGSIFGNIFYGAGNNLSNIQGANVTGAVATATTAGTVTTAAQPNITSVGTLTSITSSGNITGANIIANTYFVGSVATGISANGSTLATATALSKQYNVVSTVSAGQGVVLPTAIAGIRLTVINTSSANLNVYPSSGAAINSLGANNAFVLGGNTNAIDMVAVSSTQWYTINAVYA